MYNLDACAYHYVLISIAKSIDFASLNPYNEIRKNSKIPTTKDTAKASVWFTRVPASSL